jgi:hypothetical protein
VILAAFRSSFPEFQNVPDALISSWLASALLEFEVETWGDDLDTGHGLLTAHRLALAPYGQNARLSSKDAQTTYGEQYRLLQEKRAAGIRCL